MSLGIKKEDGVVIIAGKEKGKKGRVLAVNRDKHQVRVEKIQGAGGRPAKLLEWIDMR